MTPTKPAPPPAYVPDHEWDNYLAQKAEYERALARGDALDSLTFKAVWLAVIALFAFIILFPAGHVLGWW